MKNNRCRIQKVKSENKLKSNGNRKCGIFDFKKNLCFFYLLVFWCSPLLASGFERVLNKSSLSKNELGLCVVKSEKTYFDLNSQKKMTPASLSKILTAISVLKSMSPEKKFEPKLYIDGAVQGGYIDSPLYIQTEGDPSFVSETLWVLVNNLLREGVQKIKGPIVVDTTLFDESIYDESRQKVRVDRAYDAPVSAASLNWNSVNVYIRPGKIGEKAHVIADPVSDYFLLQNEVKTQGGSGSSLSISLEMSQKKERLIVRGSIGVNSPEVVKYAAIQVPHEWLGYNLIEFLKQRGISVENERVEKGSPGTRSRVVSKTQGWSVFEIVDGMMKYSNNFLAEMLTKQMAVQGGIKPASISDGISEIKKVLKKNYSLDSKEYDFINPSGFTNENKISACTLAQLLSRAQRDFSVGASLVASMARPGGEGTLKRRMSGLEGLVRGKTGLLNGVIGLAGFAANESGEVFSFVFMYNGSSSAEEKARNLFDDLAKEVTRL